MKKSRYMKEQIVGILKQQEAQDGGSMREARHPRGGVLRGEIEVRRAEREGCAGPASCWARMAPAMAMNWRRIAPQRGAKNCGIGRCRERREKPQLQRENAEWAIAFVVDGLGARR
jgi:hypothetical protein